MIAFPCPKCQATLKAPEEKAGATSKCRQCGSSVQVPVIAADAFSLVKTAPVGTIPPEAISATSGAVRAKFPLWLLAIIIPGGLVILGVVIGALLIGNRRKEPETIIGNQRKEPETISVDALISLTHQLPAWETPSYKEWQGKTVRITFDEVNSLNELRRDDPLITAPAYAPVREERSGQDYVLDVLEAMSQPTFQGARWSFSCYFTKANVPSVYLEFSQKRQLELRDNLESGKLKVVGEVFIQKQRRPYTNRVCLRNCRFVER